MTLAAGGVARVYRRGGGLRLELDGGKHRTVIARGNDEQMDYIARVVTAILLDGPERWVEGLAEGRPSALRRALAATGAVVPAVPFVVIAVVVLTPVCSLTCQSDSLRWGLAAAERCPLVTARLGRNITWTVGCNVPRLGERKLSLRIKGDRARGEILIVDTPALHTGLRDGRRRPVRRPPLPTVEHERAPQGAALGEGSEDEGSAGVKRPLAVSPQRSPPLVTS